MASMKDIKRRKRQHTEYAADHQSHETCFDCKVTESKGKSGTDESIF